MARYCTIDQYYQAAQRIREWKPEAGIDALRKLLLVIMSILNHEDKVDTRVHIVKDLPKDLPNYSNCIYLIQSVYDTPTVDTTQVAVLMDYVDSYINLRSEQTSKNSEQKLQLSLITHALVTILMNITYTHKKQHRSGEQYSFNSEQVKLINQQIDTILHKTYLDCFIEHKVSILRIRTKIEDLKHNLNHESKKYGRNTFILQSNYFDMLQQLKSSIKLLGHSIPEYYAKGIEKVRYNIKLIESELDSKVTGDSSTIQLDFDSLSYLKKVTRDLMDSTVKYCESEHVTAVIQIRSILGITLKTNPSFVRISLNNYKTILTILNSILQSLKEESPMLPTAKQTTAINNAVQQEQFAKEVTEVLHGISKLLIEKNRKYGDSALNPARIFSRADTVEQLKIRLDDKINRVRNQQDDEDEDVEMDLIGYLVLLRIAKKRMKAS